MKYEDSILAKKDKLGSSATLYKSVDEKGLCLYDPITQICKRIEAFFKGDAEIHCNFVVNNNKSLGPKIDPETGEYMQKLIGTDENDEPVYAIVDEEHFCEFRIFCENLEKAQCLSSVIRHKHKITENYVDSEDNNHVRDHILIVRVFSLSAVDPDGAGGGSDPWIADDNTDQGIQEMFGLEPISWDETDGYGCLDRLAPSDTSESDIPKGFPEEYEQLGWESNQPGLAASEWKWRWLKNALKGNKNILDMSFEFNDGMNTWRFIECNYMPIVFQEDNLLSARGFNSILPADLLPTIFAVFSGFQIATYARRES